MKRTDGPGIVGPSLKLVRPAAGDRDEFPAPPAAAPVPVPDFAGRAAAHLYHLDVLRAVAILAVFAFHVYAAVFPGLADAASGAFFDYGGYARNRAFWATHLFRYGGAGVPLFFVLSGFCIHLSHLRSSARTRPALAGTAGPRFDYARFVRRRFWRLYPAYAVALLAGVGLAVARGRSSADPSDLPSFAANVASHVALLHNLVPDHAFAFNGAFWSLAVEWQFYLAFPLVLWLRRRWGGGGMVAAAVGVGIASRVALVAAGVAWDSPLWFLPTVSWSEWCLGVWLADRYVAGRPAVTGRGYLIPAALLVACLASGQLVSSPLWLRSLWAAFFAAVLERYLRRETAGPSRVERALIPLGLCSYSLYLLHLPVIEWVDAAVRWKLGPHAWGQIAAGLLVALPASVAVSWVSYKWIELRFGATKKAPVPTPATDTSEVVPARAPALAA